MMGKIGGKSLKKLEKKECVEVGLNEVNFEHIVINGKSKEDWTEVVALLYACLGHDVIIVKE